MFAKQTHFEKFCIFPEVETWKFHEVIQFCWNDFIRDGATPLVVTVAAWSEAGFRCELGCQTWWIIDVKENGG